MGEINDQILRAAKQEFLGRSQVTGIGLVEDEEQKIAFLLKKDSSEVADSIRRWASAHAVKFKVVLAEENVPLMAGQSL